MADPLFGGTWTMKPERSLFSAAMKPTNETRQYEQAGNGYSLTVSGVQGGKPYSWQYTAQYDGKDHPVNGRQDVDSIEAYRVNDRITMGLFKKGHELLAAGYVRSLSADGKTLTVMAAGRGTDGKPYFDVISYTK